MRVEIDGYWSAHDFSQFFSSLDELYYFIMLSRWREELDHHYHYDVAFAQRLLRSTPQRSMKLRVKEIKFSSPGFTDLTGLAGVVRELREFLQYLIDSVMRVSDRKLDRQYRELEIAKMKVEILSRLIEIRKSSPEFSELAGEVFAENGGAPNINPLIEGILYGRIKPFRNEGSTVE